MVEQGEQQEGGVEQQGWVHSADWGTQITASAHAVMPNGGKITMQAPPGDTFAKAVEKLEQTHELYLEWGGWGGGRIIVWFLAALPLFC